jgi:hypothetical protein
MSEARTKSGEYWRDFSQSTAGGAGRHHRNRRRNSDARTWYGSDDGNKRDAMLAAVRAYMTAVYAPDYSEAYAGSRPWTGG